MTKVTFDSQIGYFLGIQFECHRSTDGDVTISMGQEAFADKILHEYKMEGADIHIPHSPYRSGHPVDSIETHEYDPVKQASLTNQLQSILGSLQWLATCTRPDLSTITNMLAKYQANPSQGHIDAAKHVLRYVKGTKSMGITFSSKDNDKLQSFVKFPIPASQITALTDANWGPQDASIPKPGLPPVELDLFKSRSVSGYVIWLGGPMHWVSKRQTITARSSAESEIYATDECVKQLQQLTHIIEELNVGDIVMPNPTPVYNDNAACIKWSHSLTTKGLRHLQMRENAVREQILAKNITLEHIAGAVNLADMFTKEDKDVAHFVLICNILMRPPDDQHLI